MHAAGSRQSSKRNSVRRVLLVVLAMLAAFAVTTLAVAALTSCAAVPKRVFDPANPAAWPPVVLVVNEQFGPVTVRDNLTGYRGKVDRQRCMSLPTNRSDYQLYAEADAYNFVWSLPFDPTGSPGWTWRLTGSLRTAYFVVPSWPCNTEQDTAR